MKTVLLVFGTRPEAIKMAPLVMEFQKHPENFKTLVCVTGQHREMLDQVLRIFQITPDYDLNIMRHGQDLYDLSSRVIVGMRDILNESQPDIVLVHGDTTTSTMTALAAFYKQIPVGHIEAGLRTHNIYSPWPEEMNRQITGRIATWHFSPTHLSRNNLLSEGIIPDNVYVTGNTVIDAMHMAIEIIENNPTIQQEIFNQLSAGGLIYSLIESWKTKKRKMVLITGHRRENFGNGFINICNSVKFLAEKFDDTDFIYPVHLNPNVQKPVYEILDGIQNIFLINPLDYLPFIFLMKYSTIILTDSGGIQEEAPSLGKPVLVMRNTTERPEAIEAGTALIVGTDFEQIVMHVSELLSNPVKYKKMAESHNPYGDGTASRRIVAALF